MSGIKDIREQCKLPFLRFQMRFDMDGRPGTILGSDGVYLRVRFDGQRFASRVHPTWQMTFYGEDGRVVKDYKQEKKHATIHESSARNAGSDPGKALSRCPDECRNEGEGPLGSD